MITRTINGFSFDRMGISVSRDTSTKDGNERLVLTLRRHSPMLQTVAFLDLDEARELARVLTEVLANPAPKEIHSFPQDVKVHERAPHLVEVSERRVRKS
jgi:hypothetical protein